MPFNHHLSVLNGAYRNDFQKIDPEFIKNLLLPSYKLAAKNDPEKNQNLPDIIAEVASFDHDLLQSKGS